MTDEELLALVKEANGIAWKMKAYKKGRLAECFWFALLYVRRRKVRDGEAWGDGDERVFRALHAIAEEAGLTVPDNLSRKGDQA